MTAAVRASMEPPAQVSPLNIWRQLKIDVDSDRVGEIALGGV